MNEETITTSIETEAKTAETFVDKVIHEVGAATVKDSEAVAAGLRAEFATGLATLKNDLSRSYSDLIRLVGGVRNDISAIEARIEKFNGNSGHKL
jgi:hypothetical protein